MKRTGLILLTALSLTFPFIVACDNDEREEIETMTSGFMTGRTDNKGYVYMLRDDFGKSYKINGKSEQLKPDTIYRMVASIALNEDNTARILQMVPTISYIAPEDSLIPDTMRVKDPVKIESIYIGGGFLNVHVCIKVQKEGTKHGLLYSRLNTPGKTSFTFYHNAYGDEPVYSKYAYVSIPLYGYGLAKNDTVFLSCKGYEEDYEYKLIYK